MPRGGKRYFMADNLVVRTAAELKALTRAETTRLMSVDEGEDAGMFADMLLLPPHEHYTGAVPSSGGGQVFLVLQGTLTDGDIIQTYIVTRTVVPSVSESRSKVCPGIDWKIPDRKSVV